MMRHAAPFVLAIGLVAMSACSSGSSSTDSSTSAVATSTSVAVSSTSTVESSTTVADAETTTAPPTTDAVTTVAATTAPTASGPTTSAPPDTISDTQPVDPTATTSPLLPCPGLATIPASATQRVTINGDIDGDTHADAVTSYSLDGVPHIHAVLASGRQSDVEIPLGFADTVSISFEDFDHSAGAPVPPPVAVLAIGAGNAGSAHASFLTLTTHYCIRQWTMGTQPLDIRISQQDPYIGMVCDGTLGSVHYLVQTADRQPNGQWKISPEVLTHNFTTAKLTPLDSYTVPDSPTIPKQYGDIVDCAHAPLFS